MSFQHYMYNMSNAAHIGVKQMKATTQMNADRLKLIVDAVKMMQSGNTEKDSFAVAVDDGQLLLSLHIDGDCIEIEHISKDGS